MFKVFSSVILFISIFSSGYGQIKVDTSYSAEDLIKKEFLQGGVEVSNVSFKGSGLALGLFSCYSKLFPLSKGIFLCTGIATAVVGPNNEMGRSGINYSPGDSSLSAICRGKTYDAAVIEFDFIPSSENVAFDFVFASEEYPEYSNSIFNDVFAFIVTNTVTKEKTNIAFLPKTHEPITVNNVNHLKNSQYYINNENADVNSVLEERLNAGVNTQGKKKKNFQTYQIIIPPCKTDLCRMMQYDGFTKLITTKIKVTPEIKYHFKIAIADVHDRIFDSGVILKAHSFKSYDKYGIIKGDTTGYIVEDEDIEKIIPEKKVVKEEKKVALKSVPQYSYTILFDFDKASVPDSSLKTLKEVSEILKKNPFLKINISGHTDSKGSDLYNLNLSAKRNRSVRRILERAGIDSKRINEDNFGEGKPVSENDTDQGRSLNRRVELKITEMIK